MANNSYTAPSVLNRYQRNGFIAGAIGLVLLLIGLTTGLDQFFHAYLLGFVVFLSLTVGCLGLLLLQHLSGGAWGVVTRRIYEASSRLMPVAAILFIPVLFGMHHIFMWTTSNDVSNLPIVQNKIGYLNTPFFIVRAAVYFIFWIAISAILNNYSKKQDLEGDLGYSRKMENYSGGGLLFYFLILTFASVDWMMSLSPEWYSTMYAFMITVAFALTAMTFAIITLVMLSKTEPVASFLKPVHLHDLGKLLFALNFLWGYMAFCQFLITYAADLPEEIIWYRHRALGGWQWVAYAVIFIHFVLPFIMLLSRDLKRNGRTLIIVATILFAMRIVDLYWLIEPNWHRGVFFLSWTDIVAPIGFVGLFVGLFLLAIQTAATVAVA